VTEYLTTEDLVRIATNILGGSPVVRDYGLLESAAARPATEVFGTEAYSDLWSKAAALAHSLIRNHALLDGNKRLGWVAMRVFLELNGVAPLRPPVEDAETFVFAIAAGEVDDVIEITKRLRALASDATS
jgi:death on curing protein